MVLAAQTRDPRLDTLIASIVDRVRPELILLFGSRVRGEAHEDSDYDLMLVVHDGDDAESCRTAAYEVRFRLGISADILACTASQYLRRQNDPGFLEWLVAREGRVLYSRGSIPQRSAHTDRVVTPTSFAGRKSGLRAPRTIFGTFATHSLRRSQHLLRSAFIRTPVSKSFSRP